MDFWKAKSTGSTAFSYILTALLLISGIMGAASVKVQAATVSELEAQQKQTEAAIKILEQQTQQTQSAIKDVQGKQEQSQKAVESLKGQSSELQGTIAQYSGQLAELNEEISEAQAALEETSGQIVELNNQLKEAQEKEQAEYESLKRYIRYSYENKTGSYLKILMSSKSMHDLQTKTEYVSKLVSYEQKKIAAIQQLQEEIRQKTAVLDDKQAELDSYQADLDNQQTALEDLTDEVRGQLTEANAQLLDQQTKLSDYNAQLSALDSQMKALESQTAAAQAQLAQQIAAKQAAMAAAGMKENLSGSYAASASELEWLAATIQAEADGEPYNGKLAVGSVIMNRVMSSNFPNTIVGVITQRLQFASYSSGKVELILSRGPNSTCLQAAQEVLNGARVGDYLFFMTQYYADYYGIESYTMIGNHAFFYTWTVKQKEETPVQTEETVSETEQAPAEENTSSEENTEEGSSEDSGE